MNRPNKGRTNNQLIRGSNHLITFGFEAFWTGVISDAPRFQTLIALGLVETRALGFPNWAPHVLAFAPK